jgi:serine/threonine-protein kinase
VVITDFGVARHLDPNEARATAVGGIVGTPAYMAPEQVEGDDVDGRTDLYSLGVLLFEAASGRLPFEGRSPLAVAAAKLLHPAPPLASARPDCSPALAELVARALARDRADRFGSATEMLAALEQLRTLPSPELSPPQPPSHRFKTERRIAVVPLRNAGTDEDAWVAEGLADDLVDSLSLADGIRVRARSPGLGRDEDLRSYGRRLDVELIIEGSVRRLGDRVRTNLRLVAIDDGFQIWARRFDSTVAELLRIGDEAAQAIADVLAGARIEARHRATPPPQAVEYYLRAKRAHSMIGGEAVVLMTQALAIAPDNPNMLAAYALFAAAEVGFNVDAPASILERAVAASQRALAEAPELPETHLALARLHNGMNEDVLAMQEALLARRLGPGMAEPDDLLGRFLADCDLLSEARRHLERAVWIDPTPGQFAHVDLIRMPTTRPSAPCSA